MHCLIYSYEKYTSNCISENVGIPTYLFPGFLCKKSFDQLQKTKPFSETYEFEKTEFLSQWGVWREVSFPTESNYFAHAQNLNMLDNFICPVPVAIKSSSTILLLFKISKNFITLPPLKIRPCKNKIRIMLLFLNSLVCSKM